MDVMTLAAQITLNSKQFENALGAAQGSLLSLAKNIAGTQLAIKGLQAGFNAVKNIVQQGINAFADYEQLTGGIETLYGGAANKMKEYANQAYKTAGLSANAYMETATSFAATLVDACKKDTDKAADLANVAIQDMSDNANKMGTDMQSIQNAYMGFAKGNFSMLDNLKLGYGGTKTEMVRLINDSGVLDKKIKNIDEVSFDKMVEAIHKIQQELGITGTTAEEAAKTISGSKSSMEAAFQNLLTFSTEGEDGQKIQEAQDAFVTSFAAYFNDNLAPRIKKGIEGSSDILQALAEALTNIDDNTLSTFVDAGLESASGLFNSLSKVTGWLFNQLKNVLDNPEITEERSKELGQSIGNFAGTLIKNAVAFITDPEAWKGMLEFGINLAGGLLNGLVYGLTGQGYDTVTGELKQIDEETQKAINDINAQTVDKNGLILWLEDLKEQYGELAEDTPEWADAVQKLVALDSDYAYFFDSENNHLKENTQALKDYTEQKRLTAIEIAKQNALAEKQQIVDELESSKANAEATIEFQKSQQQAIAIDAIDSINKLFESVGIKGRFDGSNEAALNVLREVYTRTAGSTVSPEVIENDLASWKKELAENGLGFAQMQKILEEISSKGVNFDDSEAQSKLDTLSKKFDESQEEVKKANDTITNANRDLEEARVSLSLATTALDIWAAKAAGTQVPTGTTVPKFTNYVDEEYSGGFGLEGSFATGLDRVPFDGFRAELHRNEAILNSADADEWRRGGSQTVDYGRMGSVVAAAVVEGMSRVGFYFDRDQVAAAVTDRVSQNIADGMAAWGYAG